MTLAILPALWMSRSKDRGLICSKGSERTHLCWGGQPMGPAAPAPCPAFLTHFHRRMDKLSLCCKAPQDRVSGWSVLILFFSSIVQFGVFLFLSFVAVPSLLVAACRIFNLHGGIFKLSVVVWELVPQPGIETGPLALGAQSLSHWAMREIPSNVSLPWFHRL